MVGPIGRVVVGCVRGCGKIIVCSFLEFCVFGNVMFVGCRSVDDNCVMCPVSSAGDMQLCNAL